VLAEWLKSTFSNPMVSGTESTYDHTVPGIWG